MEQSNKIAFLMIRAQISPLECLKVKLPRYRHTGAPTHFQKQVGRGTWLDTYLKSCWRPYLWKVISSLSYHVPKLSYLALWYILPSCRPECEQRASLRRDRWESGRENGEVARWVATSSEPTPSIGLRVLLRWGLYGEGGHDHDRDSDCGNGGVWDGDGGDVD